MAIVGRSTAGAEGPARSASLPAGILVFVVAAAALNIALAFPGVMTWDSVRQYAQARTGVFTDWHPPIMAWLWSFVLPLHPRSGATFLILNCVLFWGAIGSIAVGLCRLGHRLAALAVVAIACAPPFFVINMFVFKDVLMTVALLAAFACAFHFRLGYGGRAWLAAAWLLLAIALLSRSNAFFAAAPLAVYLISPRLQPWWRPAAIGVLAMAAGLLFHLAFNSVVGAKRTGAQNSLKWYDVAGIAHYSSDMSAYPPGTSRGLLDRCYDARLWDAIGRGDCAGPLSKSVSGVRPWIGGILRHPVAYTQHRLAHFNEEVFLWVPDRRFIYGGTERLPFGTEIEHPPHEQAVLTLHARLASFPLFSPAVHLLAGVFLLFVAVRRLRLTDPLVTASVCLLTSALLYGGAYLIIGVANLWRYQFYSIVAICVGAVMVLTVYRRDRLPIRTGEKAMMGALVVMLGTVVVARVVL